jgi:hypothetical protein
MNIINNSQILGSLDQNLVLNTLSKIYVRVGDKYHELNFIDQQKNNEFSDTKDPIIQTSGSNIIIVSDISELSYPGDDKFIIASNGPEFYITKNGEIKNVTPTLTSISPIQQSPAKLTTINNANVIGQLYGDNLVIDFDNNEISVKKLTVKNLIADSLTVKNSNHDQFVSGSGKMYIGPEINITKVIKKDNFVYFIFAYPQKIKHFSVTQHVTNEYDSFDGEIIEITEEFAKVRVISGDYENSTKLILKSDFLQYDAK